MKLITALHPAAVMALSIGGLWSSLEARARAVPSLSQTFESFAGLGLINGTGCVIDEDRASKNARTEKDRSCTNQQQQVDAGLAQCVKLAKGAEKAAKDESLLFQQYFKTQDSNTRNKVAQFFAKIATGCDKNGNHSVIIVCTPSDRCTLPQTGDLELAAMATNHFNGVKSIRLCRSAFTLGGNGGGHQRRQDQNQNCEEYMSNLGDLLVHEMSHSTVATGDLIYGKEGCLGLSTDEALQNADSYALFAQDVFAGCAAKPGTGKQPPNKGIGGNKGPPNDGNNRPISGGNERPPNDSPVSENSGDKKPSDGDQPLNNGDGGNKETPNDQIDSVASDQFSGDTNDQFSDDTNDQIGDDISDQIDSVTSDQFSGDTNDQIGDDISDQISSNANGQISVNTNDRISGNKDYPNN